MNQDVTRALAAAGQLRAQWQLDEAEDRYRALCSVQSLYPRTLTEVAITLGLQNRGEEALALVEQAQALADDDAPIAQNRLILEKMREPEQPGQFLELHRRFGARHAPAGGSLFRARPQAPLPRPLRIAYLGVDAHPAMKRFVPILAEHHDRSRFHPAFFYGASSPEMIAQARRRWPQINHVDIYGLAPRDLAVSLAQGGVDIAVDLIGHGLGSVLGALAYRPAPLQVTWLDYVATTGCACIDARVCDPWTDPPDGPSWCTETPLRLPVPQWCGQPPQRAPSPARNETAAATIGIVNATSKTSPRLIALACALLAAKPDLRLCVVGVASARARAAFLARVPADLQPRVTLHGRVPEAEYHQLVASIDLALDPTAFSGATTTLDCLHAGIPVLTCPGQLPHTRSSASILGALGLDALIARDDADFVARGLALLADRDQLAAWRTTLPDRVRDSSLTDPHRFMPHLERALLQAHADAIARHVQETPWLHEPATSEARRTALIQAANTALAGSDPHRGVYALETLALAAPTPAIRGHLAEAYRRRAQWHDQRGEPRMAWLDRDLGQRLGGTRP